MATSFTSEKIWASSGYNRCMYVSCSQTKGSSSENKSTVNWTLTTEGDGSTYYDTGPTTLTIDGTQRYYKARVGWTSFSFPAKSGSTSGSFTKDHNTNGSVAAIEVKLSTAIYTGTVTTKTGSWQMDSIARYFSSTPTITLSSKTETSMNFSWGTSETCSKVDVYYKKTSESSYTSANKYNNSTGATSGTFSITGLTANTSYNIYIIATRKDSGLTSNSSTSEFSTYDYPKITAVETSSLTIGSAQKLTISNPLGRSIVVKMFQNSTSGTALYTSSAITGTSHSFTPTASTLYASIPSAQSSNCVYSIVCSTVSSTKTTGTYTYKIKGDEYPTFANTQVSTYDASSEVTAITGQTAAGGWLVQSLSKMKLTINSAATGSNSATISSYKVTFNKVEKTLSVGTTGGTWDAINASGTQTATIVVTDSRGLTKSVTKDITYVAYAAPSITLTGGRQNNYGTTVDLSATYKSSSVSSKNTITVTWSGAGKSGTLAAAGTAAGNGTKTATVTGVDNNTAYNFTATITDKFGKTATSTLPVSIGMPIMFVDSAQLGVGVNTFPKGQGLWVDGKADISGQASVGGTMSVGGTVTVNNGVVQVANTGSWISDRDRVAARNTKYSSGSYTPVVGVKTKSGNWTIGNLGDNESLIFNYTTDTNYTNGNNNSVRASLSNGGGTIALMGSIFPVGSIYMSYKATSPASIYGGTWSQIKSEFIYATSATSGDTGTTGNGTGTSTGAASGNTTAVNLELSQIPGHSHTVNSHEHAQRTIGNDGNINPWVANKSGGSAGVYTSQQVAWYNSGKAQVTTYGSSPGTNSQGGGGSHSHGLNSHTHTIPYVAVYVWKRTA